MDVPPFSYDVRYMDGILLMAPTRWKLRRAIKQLNHIFSLLKYAQHPDKTFTGFMINSAAPEGAALLGDYVKRWLR